MKEAGAEGEQVSKRRAVPPTSWEEEEKELVKEERVSKQMRGLSGVICLLII